MSDRDTKHEGRKCRPKKKRRVIKTLAVILAFIAMAGALLLVFVLSGFGSYDDAKLHNDPLTTLLYDANGELILSVYGTQNRVPIGIGDVPPQLRDAFLAAEDLRFYEHIGFDVIRILGALWADIQSGSLTQGASTITQQLVKNTHLTPAKTWMRKLQEAYFAYQIEQDYSKDEILVMYMNHVYFGNGAYGVQAAAQAYFGVDVQDLTLKQSAALAAILKAPSNYAPHIEPENNKRRRDNILMTMQEEGMISAQEAEEALSGELRVIDREVENEHGWFTDAALQESVERLGIGMDELLANGYRIHTTMDTHLQYGFEAIFQESELFPENAADGTPAQAALIAVDVQTGAIQAMIGGREYSTRLGLNRATQARRQPGSTLKPFAVYAPAIERMGLTATTFLDDSPIDIDGYAPNNYGGGFSGWITARTALARSLNIPAVTILNQMGIDAASEGLSAFGIPVGANDLYLPIALGSMSQGALPLELCSAYAALGNGGEYCEPYLIAAIYDADGKQVYGAESERHRAVDEKTAFLLTDMLRSTVSWGTGTRLAQAGVTAAAKTGTVSFEGDLNRDAWAAVYTPEVSIVAWMGFDTTDAEHALPRSVTGGTLPATLAARALMLAQTEDIPFAEPGGIEHIALDKRALENEYVALLATELTPPGEIVWETYIAGTAPTQYGSYWTLPRTPVDLRVTKGIGNYPVISFTSLESKARYRIYRAGDSGETVEIIALQGEEGKVFEFTDNQVSRSENYTYFIIPEHAEAVDTGMINARGTPSARVGYTVPLLPFDLPFTMDDLFLSPTPNPEQNENPAASSGGGNSTASVTATPWVTLSPAPTATITPTPTPSPSPSPTPAADEPLILYLP